ncbi:hypothetical protein D3C71_972660 [compost metagenome]
MAEDAVNRLADVRVEVDRIDDLDVRVLRGDFRQRMADLLKTTAKALAAVARHQNHLFARAEEGVTFRQLFAQRVAGHHAIAHPYQRVNHRIAGDENFVVANVFAQQVLAGVFGWRKMVHRQMPGECPVGFFRPGRIKIASTQTRFDVPNRNTLVECGQTGGNGGRGIAVNQNDVWFKRFQNRF